MGAYTKRLLSGSTNGKGIKVAATATPGTTIHTAVTGTSDLDEVWLYAVNTGSDSAKLTIEFGGTSDPDDTIEQSIYGESGLVLIIPGFLLQNELVVKAFADSANIIVVHGFVNRIAAA